MKRFGKIALGALMLGGLALTAATPAAARVSVGIGIGVPGYYGGYYDSPCGDPDFRYWHPRYCGYPAYYEEPYYYGPSLYGVWYGGGHHYRGGWHGGYHHDGDHHDGDHGGWHHH